MEDELELDLNENNNEDITRRDNRIKSLSDKVKEKSLEAETRAKELAEAAKAKEEAEKARDFYKGFNEISTKYRGANEYQDKIWEKVQGGYDVEDATISILAREGKYTPAPQAKEEGGMAAGGSASVGIHDSVEKKATQMNRDELRSKLLDIESTGERFI